MAGDLDHGSLGLIPDREGEIPGGKKRVEVKAFPRLKAGLSLNSNPNCAYFPPLWSLRMEHSRRGSLASQSSSLCQLGCRLDNQKIQGSKRPRRRVQAPLDVGREGAKDRHLNSVTSTFVPNAAARGGNGDRVRHGAKQHLLHAHLPCESVPSPWGTGQEGVPTGVGYSSGFVEAPECCAYPGYRGGDGAPSGSLH